MTLSLSRLPEALYRRLEGLPFQSRPGFDYFPCRLVMTDGRILERAYAFKRRDPYFSYPPARSRTDALGFQWHQGWDPNEVPIDQIAAVETTVSGLSPQIVQKITTHFHRDMGEYRCLLLLKDGRRVPYIANLLVDYPDLPHGATVSDVVDALPYEVGHPLSEMKGPALHAYFYFDDRQERFLRDPHLHEAMRISPQLLKELTRIEPSQGDYRPCRLILKTGAVLEHAYAFPASRDGHLSSSLPYVWMKDVAKIEESPDRLPKRFADRLNAAGESGMGYCAFALDFRDGRRLYVTSGNYVDLLVLPEGYAFDEIVDVLPHERGNQGYISSPRLSFCPYVE